MNKLSVSDMVSLYRELDGSYAEIARKMRCSRERVRQVLSPMGLPSSHERLVIERRQLADSIANDFMAGVDRNGLCEKYKLSELVIKQYLAMRDLKVNDLRFNPSLSNENIIALYTKHKGRYRKIAKEVGVSDSVISRLIKERGLRDSCPARMGRPTKEISNEGL